jgi:phage protein U
MSTLSTLVNGMDMGKIGDFKFYMNKNEYKKISKSLSVTFGSFKPIKGQERLSDSGGFSRTISLNGFLVLQPLDSLKSLEDYAEAREPLELTTLRESFSVVITSLNINQSHFLDNGDYTVQDYSLSLKEVYDELV